MKSDMSITVIYHATSLTVLYTYDPASVFLYNIEDVICQCFTHINSSTLWKITGQGDFRQKHLDSIVSRSELTTCFSQLLFAHMTQH
jgi:hypothetical protein